MAKKLFCCIIFLTSGVLFAQPHSSLLWKISGNGLKQPSYMYGTIHSFDKRAFTFYHTIEPYIDSCRAFGMEIKLDDVDMFSLVGQLKMPGDTTLQMLIADSDYARLEAVMRDSFNIQIAMFASIKPMFLAGLLDMQTDEPSDSAENKTTVLDEFLMQHAEEKNKDVIGIETVAEQLHAIDLIPLREQANMLLDGTIRPDTVEKNVGDLLELYATGNLDSIYEYYKRGELSNTFNKALITDRNHRMAHRIDSLVHLKTIFVAVGALHLPGNKGVLNLLKKMGYEVSPIWKNQDK